MIQAGDEFEYLGPFACLHDGRVLRRGDCLLLCTGTRLLNRIANLTPLFLPLVSEHERDPIMRIAPGYRSALPGLHSLAPHLPLTSCIHRSCCDVSRLFLSWSSSLTRVAATFMASAATL